MRKNKPLPKTHVLTSEVTTGDAAPLPNPDALAPGAGLSAPALAKSALIGADPAQEYVAGGTSSSAMSYAASLPDFIDDVSRDFGADIYERMGLDAHIAGETNAYILSVLGNGLRLLPAFEDSADDVEQQRKYKKAKKVLEFCQTSLDEMTTPLLPVLDDMLLAFGMGNRVAEIVYRRDGVRFFHDRLKVKPRQTTAFVTDNRGNTVGLLGAIAGQAQIVVRPGLLIDAGQTPNLLPRNKFAVLSWRPKHGDPRGTSAYRPAYAPWWQKRQTEIELCKYIAQFAGSSLFATVGEKAEPQPMTNPDGTPVLGPGGKPVMVYPQTALSSALQTIRNGGVVVGPHGATLKQIVAEGAGAPFFQKLDYCNNEISKALLSQTLATNEGQHQARAASATAKDVMDLMVQWGEQAAATMIRSDLLRPLVLLNFGPDFLPFVPRVTLSAVEEADFAGLATAMGDLGFTLSPSQLVEASLKLGFNPPTDEELANALTPPPNTAVPGEQNDPDESAKFTQARARTFYSRVSNVLRPMRGVWKLTQR